MVFDGNGPLVGRGGTDGGGIDAIDGVLCVGSAYISTVRKTGNRINAESLKELPGKIISGSDCPGNTAPSMTRPFT
jgi:hypothetical protein